MGKSKNVKKKISMKTSKRKSVNLSNTICPLFYDEVKIKEILTLIPFSLI